MAPEAANKAVKIVVPLVDHLPAGLEYAVLMITRDLDEILASQAAMLERLGKPGAAASRLRGICLRRLDQARRRLGQRPDAAFFELEHRNVLGDPLGAARDRGGHLDLTST